MKAQIKKLDLAAIGLSAAEAGGQAAKMKVQKYLPPPKRPPVRMIKEDFPENVKTLVKLLKEEANINHLERIRTQNLFTNGFFKYS
jgi:electron transfer flavoprotein alpha/beta subunit